MSMSNYDECDDFVGADPFEDDSYELEEDAPSRILDTNYVHPDADEDEDDLPEEDDKPVSRWARFQKGSTCSKNDGGHDAQINARGDYVCIHCKKRKWTPTELEEIASKLLREDSNAELCRTCKESSPDSIPYGRESGHIEWQLQKDKEGNVLLDDNGDALYVAFPELTCDQGHRWYKGEGVRRNINGVNPILFETHIYNRRRREIQVKDGIPDPAFTMDRWGKRPTPGSYNRSHPLGRKVNSKEARAKHGASWYRAVMPPVPAPLFACAAFHYILPLIIGILVVWMILQSSYWTRFAISFGHLWTGAELDKCELLCANCHFIEESYLPVERVQELKQEEHHRGIADG